MSHPTGEHPYQPPLMYDPYTHTYSPDVWDVAQTLPTATRYDYYSVFQPQHNSARADDGWRLPDLTPPRNPQQPGQQASTPTAPRLATPPVGSREVANGRRWQPGDKLKAYNDSRRGPIVTDGTNAAPQQPQPSPATGSQHTASRRQPQASTKDEVPTQHLVDPAQAELPALDRTRLNVRLAARIGSKLVPAVISRVQAHAGFQGFGKEYIKIRSDAYEREQAELRFASIMANSAGKLPRARGGREPERLLQASRLANTIAYRLQSSDEGYIDLFRYGSSIGLDPVNAFTSLLFNERISFDGRSPEEQKADMEAMGYTYGLALRLFETNARRQPPAAQSPQSVRPPYRTPQQSAAPALPRYPAQQPQYDRPY